jgi:hypothetical protein
MMSLQCGRESSVILSPLLAEIGHYGRETRGVVGHSEISGMMSSQILHLEMTSRFKVEQTRNVECNVFFS